MADSFQTRSTLEAGGIRADYYSLRKLEQAGVGDVASLPFSQIGRAHV